MSLNGFIDKDLTIENLVGTNGNWKVVFVYDNWGSRNAVLMLLPAFNIDYDSDEAKVNNDVMNLPDGVFEEEYMIHQWNEKHGETPFLVTTPSPVSMKGCVEEMERRLAAYNNNWDKFFEDAALFDLWRKVASYVTNTDGAEHLVWAHGWEYYIDKISGGKK